jgi:hypothetical protein
MGSLVHVKVGDRAELPYLRQVELHAFEFIQSYYKYSTGGIKSSITESAPYTILQHLCETNMKYRQLLNEAAESEDPHRRLALIACHQITQESHGGGRKTSIIPMNQETYEMVLDDVRFLSECVNRDSG